MGGGGIRYPRPPSLECAQLGTDRQESCIGAGWHRGTPGAGSGGHWEGHWGALGALGLQRSTMEVRGGVGGC